MLEINFKYVVIDSSLLNFAKYLKASENWRNFENIQVTNHHKLNIPEVFNCLR